MFTFCNCDAMNSLFLSLASIHEVDTIWFTDFYNAKCHCVALFVVVVVVCHQDSKQKNTNTKHDELQMILDRNQWNELNGKCEWHNSIIQFVCFLYFLFPWSGCLLFSIVIQLKHKQWKAKNKWMRLTLPSGITHPQTIMKFPKCNWIGNKITIHRMITTEEKNPAQQPHRHMAN